MAPFNVLHTFLHRPVHLFLHRPVFNVNFTVFCRLVGVDRECVSVSVSYRGES